MMINQNRKQKPMADFNSRSQDREPKLNFYNTSFKEKNLTQTWPVICLEAPC